MKRMLMVCLDSLLLSFLLVWSPVEIRADDISLLFPGWSQVIHSPFELIDPPEITNPVLTADDVTDVNAEFVADPFIYREADTWYMFFEVFNNDNSRGEIGLATSADGMQWEYDQIVLAEYFHLSYPLVFKYDSTYYMIPETNAINEVRIYQALSFPYRWVYATTLISGKPFVDSTLFHYDGKWWMFLGQKWDSSGNDDCFLYYSENLFSGWREHPESPIVLNDASKARPAGRAFVYDTDRLVRLAQKNNRKYGQQVRVFEVDVLTNFSYAEHEIAESPVLLNSGSGWNASGMHHLDPWWTGDYWLCAVDGNDDDIWSIGIYRTLDPQNELRAEIIGTLSTGIWHWDVTTSKWTRMTAEVTTGDIAAGDFTGDGKADVASSWGRYGLWYQDGANLAWTKVDSSSPYSLTAGDVTGDGRDEIIGTWSSGIWYWDVAASTWTQMTSYATKGDIATGDFTGDGKADVASCWEDDGLWYQDGANLAWTKVDSSSPYSLTAGDVTGDGRDEIIGTWSSGIWYWDVAASKWTQMTSYATNGDIAAGDFTGDGKADVASCWDSDGLWYQDGVTLAWTKVSDSVPDSLTAGDITGD